MLPSLGRLSLTRTGGSLEPWQSPKDVTCVICFNSLAAPPPDGENAWPFDDDRVIWIVACDNKHAFHKGCLRAYARDSQDPSRCPECRVPMMPQVLTHVSRPSSGEHAAREEREAEERAKGQERDREDADRRELENLEREQREFQAMDEEERRMYNDAYGNSDSEEEEEEEEEDDDWDAVDDMSELHRLADLVNEASPYDHRRRLVDVGNQVTQIINRSSGDGEYEQYHSEVLDAIYRTADTQAWLKYVIRSPDSDYPYAVKGQVLRLLAFFADTYTVRDIIREGDEPYTVSGRLDPSTAGRFTAAVKQYMNHLETLPTIAADPSEELDYERDTRPQRLADARRVLHYLKWQDAAEDQWLQDPAQPIVNAEDETDAALNAPIGPVGMARQLMIELSDRIVEGGLDEVGNPEHHRAVMVKIWELWRVFKDWRANNYQQSLRRRFPFGRQLVQLWGLANYAQRKQSEVHTHPDFLNTGDPSEEEELQEKVDRYGWMVTLLVRTLWLSVSMFYGTSSPYGPFASRSQLTQFFYQYVAHLYTGNEAGLTLFEHNNDTSRIEEANNAMQEQWTQDHRGGPWDGPFGLIRDAPTADRPYRGEGTPDARRQRLR